jgi:septal ring-binding cell division protein DamX
MSHVQKCTMQSSPEPFFSVQRLVLSQALLMCAVAMAPAKAATEAPPAGSKANLLEMQKRQEADRPLADKGSSGEPPKPVSWGRMYRFFDLKVWLLLDHHRGVGS